MAHLALIVAVLGGLNAVSAGLIRPLLIPRGLEPSISSGCGTRGALSCSSSAKGSCCYEAPGGLILQTQFWDTNPPTGPTDSWTIHGLWPDHCDGSYSSNCDSSRDYTNIGSLLSAQGGSSTLSYMNKYWKNDPNDGSDSELWAHEWATHGTCYSTLEPSCLPSGSPRGAEAVAFFETTVGLFKSLPTYTWLKDAGITPGSGTHTLASLNAAIRAGAGVTPAFDCSGSDLGGVSYYYHLRGSMIDGEFELIDSPESSSCPKSGIRYLTK